MVMMTLTLEAESLLVNDGVRSSRRPASTVVHLACVHICTHMHLVVPIQ
jgi:hypothetical protein